MSEATPAVDGAVAATPAPTEVTQATPTQESAPASGDHAEPSATPARDEKGRFVPQERLNEVTRLRRTAERERDAEREARQRLEAELAKYQRPATDPNDRPPTLYDFNGDAAAHARALAEYVEQRLDRKTQEQQYRSAQQEAARKFDERAAEFARTAPDFHDRLDDLARTVQLHPATVEAIGHSDHGPAIAYHLAQNLDVADRISRMPPHLAAYELARIEARITAPKPQQTTKAPDPVPVLGGASALASKDPGKMSYAEYKKFRMGG
jgi:hypothetical protein